MEVHYRKKSSSSYFLPIAVFVVIVGAFLLFQDNTDANTVITDVHMPSEVSDSIIPLTSSLQITALSADDMADTPEMTTATVSAFNPIQFEEAKRRGGLVLLMTRANWDTNTIIEIETILEPVLQQEGRADVAVFVAHIDDNQVSADERGVIDRFDIENSGTKLVFYENELQSTIDWPLYTQDYYSLIQTYVK